MILVANMRYMYTPWMRWKCELTPFFWGRETTLRAPNSGAQRLAKERVQYKRVLEYLSRYGIR